MDIIHTQVRRLAGSALEGTGDRQQNGMMACHRRHISWEWILDSGGTILHRSSIEICYNLVIDDLLKQSPLRFLSLFDE